MTVSEGGQRTTDSRAWWRVAQFCHLTARGAEAELLQVRGQFELHSEFHARQGYLEGACLQNKAKKKKSD